MVSNHQPYQLDPGNHSIKEPAAHVQRMDTPLGFGKATIYLSCRKALLTKPETLPIISQNLNGGSGSIAKNEQGS